ncbi:DUF4082 domain-containing protein [Myxococcus sp. CA010]|uniref:DUF4082 domain-containing protein n=1 Tax=Myxococcus sp. CA010 TaxID=2562798 RepID=UPI001147926F|nr:DUF4082 domain-containing protein [Myxococcus sp. CA010]
MTPSKPRPNWVARQPRAHALALLAAVLLALPTAARAQPTYTLFAPTSTPAVPSVTNDFAPVELGVKFQSDIEGDILGIRFYKGPANTGTHVGSLWSAAGARLAFATFTSETATGWQEVMFSTPVRINANTTYVASYHAPGGAYGFTSAGLASTVDAPPLHALAGATSGGNGVFTYGAAGSFPSTSFGDSNYWVDVVFRPAEPVTLWPVTATPAVASVTNDSAPVELGVKFKTNVSGNVLGVRFYKGAANTGTHVGSLWSANGQRLAFATFTSETATGWQEVTFSTPVAIAANTTYVASYFAPLGGYSFDSNGLATGVDAPPLHALPGATTSGGNGVFAYASTSTFPNGSHQNANYWVDVVFETYGPPPRPGVHGAGPVLVATAPGNPFTDYLREILEAEGIAAFATTDAGNLGVSVSLDDYKVLVLGEQTLSAAQVTLITDWVTAGGSLIALRPAANLQSLLGLNASQGTQANGYILVNDTQAPGTGITAETMQYHGLADKRTVVTGTRTVATLYSDATTATTFTAVSQRTVGSGTATAFMYDLAKSVIYTRQGNPAWQGQNRDGSSIGPGARASDMFYGNASFDPQPDWVNLAKVQIPQADEQQRLLANVLHQTSTTPLPRLWYFPSAKKAVVVMTGDGHPGGATTQRWNQYLADSTTGCSVDDWECIRGTIYDYVGGLSATQANTYVAQGFEYALHINTGCADYTANTLDPNFFTPQLASFASAFPSVPAPVTNRTHCIAFSDWSTQPKVSRRHGIRLDTNYYYWPDYWVQDRPGMFTGSGLAMRFADLDGTPLDVYQLATQMTDESGQSYPLHIDTLLDNALGPKGYYGAFNANMHVDSQPSAGSSGSAAIIASAQRDGVPVITAKQLLEWLDAREATQVSTVAFTGTVLTFNLTSPARNLSLMVPTRTTTGRTLLSVTRAGSAVTTVTRTIKGVDFAFIDGALAGTYTATYN